MTDMFIVMFYSCKILLKYLQSAKREREFHIRKDENK